MPPLPVAIQVALQSLLEGRSRRELAVRAQAASCGYRAGADSFVTIRDEIDALAYAAARMPATFAAVTAAMREVHLVAPEFRPRTLLDVGCGPGTATFAAQQAWPSLASATMIDANPLFLALAQRLAKGALPPVIGDIDFVQAHIDCPDTDMRDADLVTISYALVELPADAAVALCERLWAACRGVLLIVEPGSREGFERIRRCRDVLIARAAAVLAPCTHEATCPMAAPDWCHFSRRLPRSRDHMMAKAASVPFEDEKFTYVAFGRCGSTVRAAGRVVAPPSVSKARWAGSVCTAGSIQRLDIPRGDSRYRHLKKVEWGDALPGHTSEAIIDDRN